MRAKDFLLEFEPKPGSADYSPYETPKQDPEWVDEPASWEPPVGYKSNRPAEIKPLQKKLVKSSFSLAYANKIGDLLKAECGAFIENNRTSLENGDYLYRGINRADMSTDMIIKGTVRDDRVPRDTPKTYHKLMDKFFMNEFGFPYRTASLFTTTKISTTYDYGAPFLIFPIGDYTLCYSPLILDVTLDVAGGGYSSGGVSDALKAVVNSLDDTKIRTEGASLGLKLYSKTSLYGAIQLFQTFYQAVPSGSKLSYILEDDVDFYEAMKQFIVDVILPDCGYRETQQYGNADDSEVMVRCQTYYGLTYNRPHSLHADDRTFSTLFRNIIQRALG